MCTALSFTCKDHYFGRTLDLDRSYGEQVVVMPRRHPLFFRECGEIKEHYAIIGMATVVGSSALFYDAANECGLSMAGLNFPTNAFYAPRSADKDNIAPFEFIPWILARCRSVKEAKALLEGINIADISFSDQLPNSPLHWMISDRDEDIVVESMRDGLHIYDDPVGAMTNNPPFVYQLGALEKYDGLRNDNFGVKKDKDGEYTSYSQGLGALGLPGDVSSMSRFARIAFGRKHSIRPEEEEKAVGQFFHLLSSVEMIKGACVTDEGTLDFTSYTSCINADKGRYYFTTYENRQICCVDMNKTDLYSRDLSIFPLSNRESIDFRN